MSRKCPECGEYRIEPAAKLGSLRGWRCGACGRTWRYHPTAKMKEGTLDDARPLVLVADGYDDTREMLCEAIHLSGFLVAQAESGTEALEKTFELRPDVLVLDLSLTELDGAEVTARLRADVRTAALPIIMLSGRVSPPDIARVKASGCDTFLKKPCLPDELSAEVSRLLAAHGRWRV